MVDKPLPAELARYTHLHDLSFRGGNEWSAACPHCGGSDIARRDKSDRFRLFAGDTQHNARVWCRQCGHFEWADQDGAKPSQEQLDQARHERTRLAKINRERVRAKIEKLQTAAYWRGWYEAMSQQQRGLWHEQGIEDWAIDAYQLGYCTNYTTTYRGQEWTTDTMTIPHWGPGREITNIQHRLMNPPEPGDKYRQMAGLPAAMFLTKPDNPLDGAVMVVEGAKKAIVTYSRIGDTPLGFNLHIVGIPSKTPSAKMLDLLESCDPVYLALDPDAYYAPKGMTPAVNRVAQKLGRGRVRVLKLMVKPDDFFTQYGGDKDDMIAYMRSAVRA